MKKLYGKYASIYWGRIQVDLGKECKKAEENNTRIQECKMSHALIPSDISEMIEFLSKILN